MAAALDADFLRAVQRAQWLIKAADEGSVIARCPRAGCTLTVRLSPGNPIPQTCRVGPDLLEKVVQSFEDARLFLRERREDLALSIRDVEEVAGVATDHLAKWEKDGPSKIPNTETFLEWAASLGYEVVLRPAPLPPVALRAIIETRPLIKRRVQRVNRTRARRES
jgi:transcriptional regulator with XRE-family HTH domain